MGAVKGQRMGTRAPVPLSGFFPYSSPTPYPSTHICFIHSLIFFLSLYLPFHWVGKLAIGRPRVVHLTGHVPAENSSVFSQTKPTTTQGRRGISLWLINQDQEGVLRTGPAETRCTLLGLISYRQGWGPCSLCPLTSPGCLLCPLPRTSKVGVL